MIKVEDFPEWTPPIGGYQYRLKISRKKTGYVLDATATDKHFSIIFEGTSKEEFDESKLLGYEVHKDVWHVSLWADDDVVPYSDDRDYTDCRLHFETEADTLEAAVDAINTFGYEMWRRYGA